MQRCIACGHETFRKAFDSVEPGFSVAVCRRCGLGRTEPPAAEIGAWYPESYYGRENVRFNPLFEYLTRRFRKRRAAVLHNRVPRGPVLDVGCGRGFILSYLKRLGYEPHGLEFSDTAAWHARHVLNLDVAVGDLVTAKLPEDHYHAVIFWHSLEHVADPAQALARARRLLKTGGLLAVAAPNFDSLQARLFGRRWFHLDVPRHYYHLSPRTLGALLGRQHLRVVEVAHFSAEQNPYGWLQSFYNALGFEHNLLYEMLKSRTARRRGLEEHPLQSAAVALLLPLLLPLSLALTLLETALRRGGTFELYAIKE